MSLSWEIDNISTEGKNSFERLLLFSDNPSWVDSIEIVKVLYDKQSLITYSDVLEILLWYNHKLQLLIECQRYNNIINFIDDLFDYDGSEWQV